MTTPAFDADGIGPPSLSRRFRALIVGLIVARGVASLCATPLFEGWDEYQHVGHVVHLLETGRRAVVNQTEVPLSLLTALREFPHPEAARVQIPDDYRPESYESYWRRVGEMPPRVEPSGPPPRVPLYQAQHSWWYYAMVGPVFQALGGVDDLRRSVGGLRLLNLAFTAATVWVALGVVGSRVRNRRTAGWIGLMIGVQPLFLMNGIRVASDAPGVFLATLAVSGMLTLAIDDRRLVGRSCWLGALVGAAILMKATNLALLLPLGICWLIAVFRSRPSVARGAASALTIALGVGATAGPELAYNLATYGVVSSMQEAIRNHNEGRGALALVGALRDFPLLTYFYNLFANGLFIASGWSFVGFPLRYARLHALCAHVALLGWILPLVPLGGRRLTARRGGGLKPRGRTPAFDSGWTPALCCLVCASYAAALLYHALQSRVAWGGSSTGPWYAAPVIPWFLVVVVAGASRWPRLVATPLVAALVFSSLATEWGMIWNRMLPVYSGGARGLEALERVTRLQPWYLTAGTCVAAIVAAALLLGVAALSIARGRNGADNAGEGARSPRPPTGLAPRVPWRLQPGRAAADGPHCEPGQVSLQDPAPPASG